MQKTSSEAAAAAAGEKLPTSCSRTHLSIKATPQLLLLLFLQQLPIKPLFNIPCAKRFCTTVLDKKGLNAAYKWNVAAEWPDVEIVNFQIALMAKFFKRQIRQ